MSERLILHTDGASRGNPGSAAIGVVIQDTEGRTVSEISETLGVTTNNAAEYHALIRALEAARELGADSVEVCMDSELLVKQMTGAYKIKHPNLLPLAVRARSLLNSFMKAEIKHVPREENRRADKLANAALSRKPAAMEAGSSVTSEERVVHRYISTHVIACMTRQQLRDLITRLKTDGEVRVVRTVADTIDGKMVCEFEAVSREAVIGLLARHNVHVDWLLRAEIDERT